MKKRTRKTKRIKQLQKKSYGKLILVVLTAIAIVIISNFLQTNLTNLSRAQTGNFHLTQELYGSNASDGLNFNVHVIFNFDGCDGDIMLYEGGKHIAGPNGWKGPGNFTYNETWTASPKFIPNDGQPHTISYRGSVNRCPRSPDTLWDEISCVITFDASGYPQVAPNDKCTIKNPSEIAPAPLVTPKAIVPTSVAEPIDNTPAPKSPVKPTKPLDIILSPTGVVPPTAILPTDTPPTVTPAIQTDQAVIQFMGIKLGRLSASQPLDFIRIIINFIKTLGN